MKPISLEITGLNSFRGKQTIEFGPLLQDGLFGIFGPTGSGKSTILDAMTLALYGKIKRAQNGKGGIINIREKACSVRFAFEIECDGRRRNYSIERVFARAAGRADGVQTKRARLIEHAGDGDVVLAEKQSDIDAGVHDLLGIEYHEFMRAVVLPQGSFADFLALAPRERAGALQRLFGLQELGQRLSSRLRMQAERMKTERAGLEGRLAELRAYDDDAVATCADLLAEAVAHEQKARAIDTEAARCLNEAEALHALLQEQTMLRDRDANREHEETVLAEMRDRLERSQRAHSIAVVVEALEDARKRHEESEANHLAAVARRAETAARLTAATERRAIAVGAFDARYDALCQEISQLEAVAEDLEALVRLRDESRGADREADTIQQSLTEAVKAHEARRETIASTETRIASLSAQLASIEVSAQEQDRYAELSRLTERVRERELALAGRLRDVSTLDSEIAELTTALERVRTEEAAAGAAQHAAQSELQLKKGAVEELGRDLDAIAERYRHLTNELNVALALEEQWKEHEQECAKYAERVAQQETQWKVIEHKFHGVSERHQSLKVAREDVSEQLQAAYRRLAVATLAPHLHAGEACPLCGSLEHPDAVHGDSNGHDELSALEAELARIDREIVEARDRLDKCSQNMAEIRTTKSSALETITRGREAIAAVRTRLSTTLVAAGEDLALASADDLRRYLEEVAGGGKQAREMLAATKRRVDELEELVSMQHSAINDCLRQRADLEARNAARREQHLDARNEVSRLQSEIAELLGSISEATNGATIEHVESTAQKIRESVHAAQHLRSGIANEQNKLVLDRAELEQRAELRSGLEKQHLSATMTARRIASEVAMQSETIREKLSALGAESSSSDEPPPIEKMLASRAQERDRLKRDRSDAEEAWSQAAGEDQVAAAAIESCAAALARDEKQHAARATASAEALATNGFQSVDDALCARLDNDARSELTERIRQLDEDLRGLATKLRDVEARIDGRSLTPEDLLDARTQSESATRAMEAAIGRTASARDEHARVVERNKEYHAFAAENAGVLDRERTAEQLGKFLQGDAFVNFLADERLADVCLRASAMLADLSGGRFEIYSRPEEGFIIRDMANGGLDRSPSSLSGGETFVVSLSLALALSDTIQMGRSPLEFFFLDEGFGTLDAELLETVFDTLERLRSRRRTIGLITHVGMLRERVSRRLVVSPPVEGRGTAVHYEVA